MFFFGHIAASLLIADATKSDRAAVVAGNLAPDITDKTLALLKLTPSRWLAHGLPGYFLVSAAAFALLDRRRSRGVALGYAGHLLCDLWAGAEVPWLAPFQPRPRRRRKSRLHRALFLLPELVGFPLTLRLLQARTERRTD